MTLSGFTLIEAIIVISILGVLFTVLFRSYATTSELVLRTENEQQVVSESLFLSQFLDTIADQTDLAHDAYLNNTNAQLDTDGYTNQLLLRSSEGIIQIQAQGSCEPIQIQTGSSIYIKPTQNCHLIARYPDKDIPITNPEKVYVANTRFKVLPTIGYSGDIYTALSTDKIQAPGFQIQTHVFLKQYRNKERAFNVHLPLQTFFSMSP